MRDQLKKFLTLPIKINDFTAEELHNSITIQNNKESELYNILAELWKTNYMKNELLTICWKTCGNVPENLKEERYILPLSKKGDFGQTVNYRDIIFSVVVAQIYNRMLLNRLRLYMDTKLRIN